jgi:hypothetical protein
VFAAAVYVKLPDPEPVVLPDRVSQLGLALPVQVHDDALLDEAVTVAVPEAPPKARFPEPTPSV